MKAEDFPELLKGLTIEGVTVEPAPENQPNYDPGSKPLSGLQHGFIVTGPSGGRLAWQVAMFSDKTMSPKEGTPPPFPSLDPVVKDGRMSTASVQSAIAAWLGTTEAKDYISSLTFYDGNPGRGIQYGIRIELHSGEIVFIQLLWSLAPKEVPDLDNKFKAKEFV